MHIRPGALTKSLLLNLLTIFLIVYIAGPFLWVISASFQGENELLTKPPSFIPKSPTTDNYRYVFTGQVPTSYDVKGQLRSRISQEARLIAPALNNSFLIALIVVLLVGLFFGLIVLGTFFESGTMLTEFITVAMMVGTYVVFMLGLITLYNATVRLSVWRLTAGSIELSDTRPIAQVKAAGDASSPLGEGIADVLNLGGI